MFVFFNFSFSLNGERSEPHKTVYSLIPYFLPYKMARARFARPAQKVPKFQVLSHFQILFGLASLARREN